MTVSKPSDREIILHNLRRRVTAPPPDPLLHQPGDTIQFGDIHHFISTTSANQVRVNTVEHVTQVTPLIADYLKTTKLPLEVRVSAAFLNLGWADHGISANGGSSDGCDRVCLSEACAGIADTGTVAVLSSAGNPTLLGFLPDLHILLLSERKVVAGKNDLWNLLKQEGTRLPRALNFISGPSRTADIEQTIQLGAHGPRTLWLILYATP